MANFTLKSKINSLLKSTGKPSIVEINFLGTGGAFDQDEKNSSAVVKTAAGTILIDCGFTVYPELRKRNLVEDIDYVFITHCHEDHIGSLSTFICHKYFIQNKVAKIECSKELEPVLKRYLAEVCGHFVYNENTYLLNSNVGELYKDLNMLIYKIDTTGLHYNDYPTSGLVFNFKKSGQDLFLLYSGDINIPFTNVIEKSNPILYESILKSSENTFIFHESTAKSYPPGYPHCEYQKLEEIADTFPNIYTYHHSKKETESILRTMKESKMKLDAIKRAIDFDLNKKISLIKEYEVQEKLRVQAKRLKDDFTEDFNMEPLKTKDLNSMGTELIIQEDMGL